MSPCNIVHSNWILLLAEYRTIILLYNLASCSGDNDDNTETMIIKLQLRGES